MSLVSLTNLFRIDDDKTKTAKSTMPQTPTDGATPDPKVKIITKPPKKSRNYVHKRKPLNCDFYKKMYNYFNKDKKTNSPTKRDVGHLRCKISKFFTDKNSSRISDIRWKNGLILYTDILEVYEQNPSNFTTSGKINEVLEPFKRDELLIENQILKHFGIKFRTKKLEPLDNIMLNKIDWKEFLTLNYLPVREFIREMHHQKEIFRRGKKYKAKTPSNLARVEQFKKMMKYFISKNERVLLYASAQYYLQRQIDEKKETLVDNPALDEKLSRYFTSKMIDTDKIRKSLGVNSMVKKRQPPAMPAVFNPPHETTGVRDKINNRRNKQIITTKGNRPGARVGHMDHKVTTKRGKNGTATERAKKGISDFDAFSTNIITQPPVRVNMPNLAAPELPKNQIKPFEDATKLQDPSFPLHTDLPKFSGINLRGLTGGIQSLKLPNSNDRAIKSEASDKQPSSKFSIYDGVNSDPKANLGANSKLKADESSDPRDQKKQAQACIPKSSDGDRNVFFDKETPKIRDFTLGSNFKIDSFDANQGGVDSITRVNIHSFSKIYHDSRAPVSDLRGPELENELGEIGHAVASKDPLTQLE